jgi:hypothetical protein
MANVLGQLTIGELQILEIDADPSIGGLAAPLSSVAMLFGSGTGNVWVKTGTSNTAWTSTTVAGAVSYQVDGGNATSNYNQTSPIDGGGA